MVKYTFYNYKLSLLSCSDQDEITSKIKILLAGTGFPKNADQGKAYKLLNRVLGVEKEWEIILTGNEIDEWS
ncbi:hypothetical protein [Vibrio harveyi]|uniref:hypothetical protein n=1 Tax=Vibrio harveyi TaxID=669 RepID=UPI003CF70534